MDITVTQIFYKPIVELETIDIFGFKYIQRTLSPNLYVVETENEIPEGSDVEFKYNKLFYTLEGVSTAIHDGKTFIQCSNWTESMF
jgi:hypothetical protein